MKNISHSLVSSASCFVLSGCASSRYEALEKRQDGVDARHNERMDRRELRSDRADARSARW